MRAWLAVVALLLLALGWAFHKGAGVPNLGTESALLSFAAAGAFGTVAVLPFPYAARAAVSLLLAITLMVVGLRGVGPLSGLVVDGGLERDAARLVAVVALAATLMFRARYYEYRRSQGLLLTALALSLPFVIMEGALMADMSAALALRAWAAVSALVVFSALLGLTPAAAGVGAHVLAGLVLLLVPIGIALRAWTPLSGPDSGALTYPLTAVAFVTVCLPAAYGVFQLLAWVFGPEARAESTDNSRA